MFRAAALLLALLAAACSSTPKDELPPDNPFRDDPRRAQREARAEAGTLYKAARKSLDSGDYVNALTRCDQITVRFPFTEYATQCELERIYCQYRGYEPEKALFGADKFLREHPRHPAVDYAQYLKGLVNAERDNSFAGFLGMDTTKQDVSNARRAFDDFALLVQKYPNSRYAGDARQRMIFLRNRLAEHDMHVVRYYVKRGAHIAAAKRAEQVLTQYPGAPATREALRVMSESYRALGLTQQADDAAKLLATNTVAAAPAASDTPAAPPPAAKVASDEPQPWLTLTIPSGDKKKDAAATADAAAQPAAKPDGGRLSITMEPYDDAPAKPAAEAAKP